MKKLIILLLMGFSLGLHAQFDKTKEEAFVGAENLFNNTIAHKYVDDAGNFHEIVKVSFTEKAIVVTERIKEKGSRQYGDAIENSYYKIPWNDIGLFEFIVTTSSTDMLELKIHFKNSLSYKPGTGTEQLTNTITLMVLAKDKEDMDRHIKSIQHFFVKE
jgi:hypothetical protein